jgi:VanZ family protein
VVAWLAVIAANSTELASIESVESLVRRVADLFGVEPGTPRASSLLRRGLLALRKPAHVVQYAVLGALTLRALTASGRRRLPAVTLVTLLFALAVATADELHQRTVEARTGSAADVAFDTAGAAFGLMFMLAWRARGRRR